MSDAVIHDIGYRGYDGPRLGRPYAVRALAVHGLRAVFGLRRPARSKIIPIFLSVTMLLPALVVIAVMAIAGEGPPMPYPSYAFFLQVVLAIFLATQTPALIAPDMRFGVLPLYFARPGTHGDYILARFLSLFTALLLLVVVPITVMFAGELLVSPPVPLHVVEYLQGLAGSVLLAALLAAAGLAIGSLTHRRGLGVAAIIGVYMIASTVSIILQAVLEASGAATEASWALLINPFGLIETVQVWMLGVKPTGDFVYPPGGGPIALLTTILLIVASGAVLFARYRKAASR